MKRFILFLLALTLSLSFAACNGDDAPINGGESEEGESQSAALDIESEADYVIEKYSLSGGKRYSSSSQAEGGYLDEELIRSYYGDSASMPDFSSVEAYCVYIDESQPINPCEFGIFKMKGGANTEEFMLYLKARINLKLQNAVAYPTMDTEALETAVFTEKDGYIWYFVVKGGNSEINNYLEGKLD